MNDSTRMIDLGFCAERMPCGVHVCQIVGDDEEGSASLLDFVLSGLRGGELAACFSDRVDEGRLDAHLRTGGVDPEAERISGALALSPAGPAYFAEGRFDPDRLLERLRGLHRRAGERGCAGARVIGEMLPEIERIEGGARLMEYESRVSLLLRECPVTAVCQYDARAFSGATILDVLKVHPLMVVRGSVVRNPFFIPPEEVLAAGERS